MKPQTSQTLPRQGRNGSFLSQKIASAAPGPGLMVSLKFPAWEISHCVEPLDWLDWLAKVSELMFFY